MKRQAAALKSRLEALVISGWISGKVLRAAVVAGTALAPGFGAAKGLSACTANDFCYCVDDALFPVIDQRVDMIHALIADQKKQGKAVGYLSVPLSSVAGSYYGVNAEVAVNAKDRIEARLGQQAAWVLNPAARELVPPGEKGLLPTKSGAAYMLMWTKILEGSDGLGAFDFVYFVGPADFASEFKLDGKGDMAKIEAYYDTHAKSDGDLAKIDRRAFRDYYGLRASVAFSLGSHDEWNIVRTINERRRSADAISGIVKQIAVFFDGQPVAPGQFQASVEPGDAGACRN